MTVPRQAGEIANKQVMKVSLIYLKLAVSGYPLMSDSGELVMECRIPTLTHLNLILSLKLALISTIFCCAKLGSSKY